MLISSIAHCDRIDDIKAAKRNSYRSFAIFKSAIANVSLSLSLLTKTCIAPMCVVKKSSSDCCISLCAVIKQFHHVYYIRFMKPAVERL